MTHVPRILVIGYCYPPTASPEAFVSAKLLRNIPDCKIDVLTLEDGLVSDFCDTEMGEYGSDINGDVTDQVAMPFATPTVAPRSLDFS